MPVLWLGNIKEMSDGSLLAGVYPGYYQNSKGQVLACGISFYKSTDVGLNWKIVGKIPYQTVEDKEPRIYDGSEGFNEPMYEILQNGSLLCVMRTGFFSPLYRAFSKDGGRSWSRPEPFTANGVKPRLIRLGNGALVLSSGRPGVQLRFCLDGDGKIWTEPIDMIPFMDGDGKYQTRIKQWPSCGYTGIMVVDDHTFYMVYSDFTTKNKQGEIRKSIIFRKIEVIK